MRVLDLFSGIGGFSLGLERAGMETVAFCEFDKKAQLVLKKHWPDVPIFDDVRELTYGRLEGCGLVGNSELYGRVATKKQGGIKKTGNDCKKRQKQASKLAGTGKPRNVGRVGETHQTSEAPTIDLICGGFPCQPFSVAGKQKGDKDDRHLWPEYFRLIQEIRPRWVIGENVAGLISMGLDQVLFDLESENYTVQTFNIPACAVNAPHRRDRVWIVAHSDKHSQPNESVNGDKGCGELGTMAHADNSRRRESREKMEREFSEQFNGGGFQPRENDATHANGKNLQGGLLRESIDTKGRKESGRGFPNKCRNGRRWDRKNQWAVEPELGRVANGVPNRVDRLKQLGNAVVPQVVEVIGKSIMEVERNGINTIGVTL